MTPQTFIATAALLGSTSLALAHPPGGYGDLVEDVGPAVVFIEVQASVLPAATGQGADEFLREYRRRFGDQAPLPGVPDNGQRARRGLGSGFLIDEDGRIVTNHHVIENAETVKVRLADGREFEAEVIGSDALTDIAVLEIDANGALPFVDFGESDTVRVGDAVIAMGNPFGLGGTVTSGIVSAMSRNINAGPFDDFIQTDAAINRGNSGGPLFNEAGEVIGVNTAIFSPAGGSVGIGFAIPSEIAKEIVADLSDDGTIERGWLGVQIRPMTEEVAEVLGYDGPTGAVVEDVFAQSPAQEAGFENGDIILSVDGMAVEEMRDLPRIIAGIAPETETKIDILRKGETLTLSVMLGLRDNEDA